MSLIWIIVAITLDLVRGPSSTTNSELISLFVGLILLCGVTVIPNIESAARLLPVGWLIAFVPTAIIALREIVFGVHFYNYYVEPSDQASYLGFGNVASTFGNPNNYACFLVASIPFLLLGAWSAATRKARILYFVAVGFCPILMLATNSRLGLMILVVEFLILVVTSGLAKRLTPAFAILVVVVLSLPAIGSRITSFSADTWEGLVGPSSFVVSATSGTDASVGARLNLIKDGLHFTNETYFVGLGPGGFETRMNTGEVPFATSGISDPHSGLIEILSQYGMIVFLVFVIFLWQMFRVGHAAIRNSGRPVDSKRGFAGMVIVILVVLFPLYSLMNSSFIEPSLNWSILSSLLVLALSLEHRELNLNDQGGSHDV